MLSKSDLYDFLELVCYDLASLTLHSDSERHFYGSFDEAMAAKGNKSIKWPIVIMGPLKGSLKPNNIDAKNAMFFVLKQAEKGDWIQQRQAFDDCLEIGMAMIERINQYRNDDTGKGSIVKYFNTDSVSYDEIGSTIDNSYGMMFTFSIGGPRVIKTDL